MEDSETESVLGPFGSFSGLSDLLSIGVAEIGSRFGGVYQAFYLAVCCLICSLHCVLRKKGKLARSRDQGEERRITSRQPRWSKTALTPRRRGHTLQFLTPSHEEEQEMGLNHNCVCVQTNREALRAGLTPGFPTLSQPPPLT